MKKVSVKDFRQNLAMYIEMVRLTKESIVITRNGKEMIVISPVNSKK